MEKVKWGVTIFMLLAVTGCASEKPKKTAAAEPPPAPVAAAPAPKPAPAPAPVAIEVDPLDDPHTFPARDFCVTGQNCRLDYAAYGYIVFTRRPTTKAIKKRYLSICEAFIGNLEPASEFAKHTPKSRIATTFWLLTAKPKNERSCKELIDLYDYARATEIATSIRRLNSAGPILVAWSQTPPVGENKQLLIDLGKFTPNDLDSAFRIWRDKISQDQKFWGHGFDMDLVLAEFRSFIGKYGDMIIQVVKPA